MSSGAVLPRTGAKRTMLRAIRLIPSFVRMLFGLMRDHRVSRLDRALVLGAFLYVVSPLDFIPDLIPFFGQVDDLFLVMLAVQRLMDGAGRQVLLQHWRGAPEDLSDANVSRVLGAAALFLPSSLRRRLARVASASAQSEA